MGKKSRQCQIQLKNSFGFENYSKQITRIVPKFRDKPPSVGRKLEWNPCTPPTPPPTSNKLSGGKKDCLTNIHPLSISTALVLSKLNRERARRDSVVPIGYMMPQTDVKHSQGISRTVICIGCFNRKSFCTPNGFQGYCCCIYDFHLESF